MIYQEGNNQDTVFASRSVDVKQILPSWSETRKRKAGLFFFIVVPCILISIQFIHQQMHYILNLTKF